ncbi:DUF2304 domain-containing protein [Cellulomonas sp. NPDC058312]|uniref:DUF2304 domain-containing protein n=1 Tax=Cellulomonas sp. NPDC058312 TaxID=3346441 RepID=UPI0036E9A0F2
MLIKLLLLLAIAVIAVLSVRSGRGARRLAFRRIGVIGFAVLAAASVLLPDAWNELAAVVGVGRGTDLILYGLIVLFFASMVTSYRRFREMETLHTVLARRIALDEAFGVLAVLPPGTAGPVAPAPHPDEVPAPHEGTSA